MHAWLIPLDHRSLFLRFSSDTRIQLKHDILYISSAVPSDMSVRGIRADDVGAVDGLLRALDHADVILADLQRALTSARDAGEADCSFLGHDVGAMQLFQHFCT